jgi:hypothetical protein
MSIRMSVKNAARPAVMLTGLAAGVVFTGGLLLGYVGTGTAPVQAASLVNLPAPTSSTATPSLPHQWGAYFLGHPMSASQRYTCEKFGPACPIALAIQAAENGKGNCEAYHYNSDGTLDWGYFQINSVHISRRGVNLRDLLDCKANIDFAYRLYTEEGFQPWSTFVSGQYRRFYDDSLLNSMADALLRDRAEPVVLPAGGRLPEGPAQE